MRGVRHKRIAGAAVAALLAVASAVVASQDGSSHRATAAGTCPTHPNHYRPHWGGYEGRNYHGGPGVYVDLGPHMTIFPLRHNTDPHPPLAYVGQVLPNGTIRTKVMWRRDVTTPGRLNVTGERLGGSGERLRTKLTRGPRRSMGAGGDLIFSRSGCWHIDARWARTHLGFVVRVLEPQKPRD